MRLPGILRAARQWSKVERQRGEFCVNLRLTEHARMHHRFDASLAHMRPSRSPADLRQQDYGAGLG